MTQVFMLCAFMTGGFSCLPMAGEIECANAAILLHSGVIIESECDMIEMRSGSIYAPEWAPIPTRKP